jgi:hypothetical protein
MNNWQPIETVPRGRAPVDLWVRSYFWNADGAKQLAVEFRLPEAIWFNQQWTDADGNPFSELDGFTNVEFTHWQPLPEPPDTE